MRRYCPDRGVEHVFVRYPFTNLYGLTEWMWRCARCGEQGYEIPESA